MKVNEFTTTYRWVFARVLSIDINNLQHCILQGDTLVIGRVRSEDFGVYTCKATSYTGDKWIDRTFDIELTERGKFNRKLTLVDFSCVFTSQCGQLFHSEDQHILISFLFAS